MTMDINTCVYDENEELSLPEFHKKYRDQFPITAIVVGGHYGQTKWDDLPSDLVCIDSTEKNSNKKNNNLSSGGEHFLPISQV